MVFTRVSVGHVLNILFSFLNSGTLKEDIELQRGNLALKRNPHFTIPGHLLEQYYIKPSRLNAHVMIPVSVPVGTTLSCGVRNGLCHEIGLVIAA